MYPVEMVRNDLIIKECKQIRTPNDLLRLMNRVKREKYGFKAYPFTLAQLFHFSDTRRNRKHYRPFRIPKRSGGYRTVTAPCGMLKSFQTVAGIILQAFYETPPCVNGFVTGKSVKDNASPHVGMNYVFNSDLKDFFPSISLPRVWKTLQCPPFRFSSRTASILAGICCTEVGAIEREAEKRWEWARKNRMLENGEEDTPSPDCIFADPVDEIERFLELAANTFQDSETDTGEPRARNALPQGAPSSPILSNIVCRNLDRKLSGLARRFGLNYSRYADDITFSSLHNVYHEGGDFITEFRRIVAAEGFTLNEKKTRLLRRGQRQEVTGLTVNTKVNIPRAFVRDLDNVLYIWKRYGASAAYAKLLARNLHIHPSTGPGPRYLKMEDLIKGRLGYVRMIKGEDSPVWLLLQARFEDCSNRVPYGNIRYIHSWRIADFESLTGLELRIRKIRNLGWSCFFGPEESEEFVPLSKWCRTRLGNIMESGDREALESFKQMNRIGLCCDAGKTPGQDLPALRDDTYDFECSPTKIPGETGQEEEQCPYLFGRYEGWRFFWLIYRRHASCKKDNPTSQEMPEVDEAKLKTIIGRDSMKDFVDDLGLVQNHITISGPRRTLEEMGWLFEDMENPF